MRPHHFSRKLLIMPITAIYYVIKHVPYGRVTTYGRVAQLAGLGRGARVVARALKQLPPDTELPWHRVINSRGAIALPPDSSGYGAQREKLQQEGIIFSNDRINFRLYGWVPTEFHEAPPSPGADFTEAKIIFDRKP